MKTMKINSEDDMTDSRKNSTNPAPSNAENNPKNLPLSAVSANPPINYTDENSVNHRIYEVSPSSLEEELSVIPETEGKYGVTRDGRIWSYRAKKWRKLSLNQRGYYFLGLRIGGRYRTRGSARLVAQTYIPNPQNLPQVNHLNGIKTDNRVENLEWCTALENQRHARRTGLIINPARGSRMGNARLQDADIPTIRKLLETERTADVAKRFGVHPATINSLKQGKSWTWLK